MIESADNKAEAIQLFWKVLDSRTQQSDQDYIHSGMGEEYRKLNKFDQAIHHFQCCCVILDKMNEALGQTYSISSNTVPILLWTTKLATVHSQKVDNITTITHPIHAQLFYFNGGRIKACGYLKHYVSARLTECKHNCYSCKQQVGNKKWFGLTFILFGCGRYRVALYCKTKK